MPNTLFNRAQILYGSRKGQATEINHKPSHGAATQSYSLKLSKSLSLYRTKGSPVTFTFDWADGPYISFTSKGITDIHRSSLTPRQAAALVADTLAEYNV